MMNLPAAFVKFSRTSAKHSFHKSKWLARSIVLLLVPTDRPFSKQEPEVAAQSPGRSATRRYNRPGKM
jgi:hypothetical protein